MHAAEKIYNREMLVVRVWRINVFNNLAYFRAHSVRCLPKKTISTHQNIFALMQYLNNLKGAVLLVFFNKSLAALLRAGSLSVNSVNNSISSK